MNYRDEKMVDFTLCKECEDAKTPEDESPCDECLMEPVNQNSVKPTHFRPRAKRGNKKCGSNTYLL